MSRRRYRIGVHPRYDQRFDNIKRASQILSPMNFQVAWLSFQMGDERSVTKLLAEWKSKLSRAENAVAELDWQFEQVKAERAKTGRDVPWKRDDKAEAAYLDAVAEMDVTGEEVDKLEVLLAKFTKQRSAAEAAQVLKYGPRGVGRIGPGNVLAELDGQTVKINEDGVLAIADPRSPYDRLPVQVYKEQLVLPWLKTHGRIRAVEPSSLPPRPQPAQQPKRTKHGQAKKTVPGSPQAS